MHKTIALCLAVATSCKPEAVTLGVRKNKDKPSVPVAKHDAAPISLEEIKRPNSLSITHDNKVQQSLNTAATYGEALRLAAKKGDIATVKTLLNKPGIDVDTKDIIGKTPLHYAKDAATVRLLLDKGANVNTQDINGNTALYEAALAGRYDAIQALIKAGVNAQEALKHAANLGYVEALQYLIKAGAEAQSVLYETTEQRRIIAVKSLIKAGVNAQDAVHHAARRNDIILLKAIISAGNAVKAKDNDEQPLWLAYAIEVQTLIESNVDINARNTHGSTPLHTAARKGKRAVAWALLARGANIEIKDKEGKTPLHIAAEEGMRSLVWILLAKGANIEARNNSGWTPLHLAAWKGKIAVVRLLLVRGADIEAENHWGYTPLHWVAYDGQIAAAEILINNKARINPRIIRGCWKRKTPLGLARTKGRATMVEYLRKHGGSE